MVLVSHYRDPDTADWTLTQCSDGKHNKPWVDGSTFAARDFWNAKDQWLPTWGEGNDRGMTVKSVKMWQQGKC